MSFRNGLSFISGTNRIADLLHASEENGHPFDVLAKPVPPELILDRLKATWLSD